MTRTTAVGVVIIGRNEGERLKHCLASVSDAAPVVYVDSGSTDGSQDAARAAGAHVVDLDMTQPFTAARARNAGLDHLRSLTPVPEFVQFVDGDCELQPGWIDTARACLDADARIAAACGRRRERFPEASIYNRLTDLEWDTPVGQTLYCGGDVLMRVAALTEVGDYNPTLIAGEEPELCVRLRAAGWTIWRLDAEMTLHDAAMVRFSQWWKRTRRAGHAYAEGAALHGRPPERHRVRQTLSALIWGVGVPVLAVLLALVSGPLAVLILLLWPLQVVRLVAQGTAADRALFLVLGKIPEALGVLGYVWRRVRGGEARLIEYK